ncbi:hypothetical protein GCM10025771_29380 [Niveibacterium umoris]|uniref:Transporter n=1 Tax=Niveibacterium umoris TaxID=1193620 RepID=A0A840BJX3_9RHOO|nr:transporter [Niveibacterium umoris]MBB4011869.1 hypothetical protein [Niveibacterium umoris]
MGCLFWLLGLAGCPSASAQSIEPRNYSNAPIDVNFLILGGAHSKGGAAFDPALPVKNPQLAVWSSFVAYARVFDLAGQSGRVDVVAPYAWLSGTADYQGRPVERQQQGLTDSIFRVSYNLIGAPAVSAAEFRNYKPDLIVGASLEVTAPSGVYDNRRIVNIGSNRWTIKPEVGMSKTLGPCSLELAGAVTFYTANNDFYGGATRTQDPLYSVQVHGVYNFSLASWLSLSATYFQGGRTTIGGKPGDDLQENWRLGATLAVPLSRYQSIKLAVSNGVYARTGNNMSLVSLGLQTRWGAGM